MSDETNCANPYCDRPATIAVQIYGKTVAHTCETCARPIPVYFEIPSEEDE